MLIFQRMSEASLTQRRENAFCLIWLKTKGYRLSDPIRRCYIAMMSDSMKMRRMVKLLQMMI